MWSLTAKWEWSMVQWPAHFTLHGLWLQSESEAWCSDQHTLHYIVFDCKVRVKHGAVTSTLYIRWSLTARWECSTVQWPAHLTLRGLWLQGESAAWCSDNHNLHAVSDCKVRVSMVQWPAHLTLHVVFDCKVRSAVWCCDWQYYPVKSRAWWPAHGVSILVMSSTDSGSDQQLSHQSCSVVSQGSLKPAIRCFTRISKACNQMFHRDH